MDIYLGHIRIKNGPERIIGYYQDDGKMNSLNAEDKNELLEKLRARFKSQEIRFLSKDISYFNNLLNKPELLKKDELTEIIDSYDKVKNQVFKSK